MAYSIDRIGDSDGLPVIIGGSRDRPKQAKIKTGI
jgi:hypothetical protein